MARSRLRSMLDRTVQHKRPSYAPDAMGGRTPTYAVLTADVPASIWPMAANPMLANAFDRKDIVTDYAICTDRDISAKAKDEIVDADGSIYLVEGSMKFENTMVENVTVYVMAANLRIV